jgi:hypothetical protein
MASYYLFAVLAVGFLTCLQPLAAQDIALDFKQGFIDSYTRALMKKGANSKQAGTEATCLYEVLATHLTTQDWIDLFGEMAASQPPKVLKPLAPVILARCGLSDRLKSGGPDATQGTPPQPVEYDHVNSALVARQVRRIRLEEETKLQAAQGHPVELPTGSCTADVTLSSQGLARDPFPVHCSNPQLQADMRNAVIASGVLRAPPGSAVTLIVAANDPEPGAVLRK